MQEPPTRHQRPQGWMDQEGFCGGMWLLEKFLPQFLRTINWRRNWAHQGLKRNPSPHYHVGDYDNIFMRATCSTAVWQGLHSLLFMMWTACMYRFRTDIILSFLCALLSMGVPESLRWISWWKAFMRKCLKPVFTLPCLLCHLFYYLLHIHLAA